MPRAKVTFQRLVQDSQDYQSEDPGADHLISKVFFTLEVDGRQYENMSAEVKQPYGTQFESEVVEVTRPLGSYEGKWNLGEFGDLAEAYIRHVIGSQGHGIRFSGGTVRMRGNVFEAPFRGEFDIPD